MVVALGREMRVVAAVDVCCQSNNVAEHNWGGRVSSGSWWDACGICCQSSISEHRAVTVLRGIEVRHAPHCRSAGPSDTPFMNERALAVVVAWRHRLQQQTANTDMHRQQQTAAAANTDMQRHACTTHRLARTPAVLCLTAVPRCSSSSSSRRQQPVSVAATTSSSDRPCVPAGISMLCAGLLVLDSSSPLLPAAAAAAPADPTLQHEQHEQHSILGKMRQLLGGSKQGECGPAVRITEGRVMLLGPCMCPLGRCTMQPSQQQQSHHTRPAAYLPAFDRVAHRRLPAAAEPLPPLATQPHGSTDKVAELRQLTGAVAQQQQQQQQEAGVAQGAAEAAAVQALSSVLDVNEYSARSLVDQEPALLEVKEKQLKVGRQEGGEGRGLLLLGHPVLLRPCLSRVVAR